MCVTWCILRWVYFEIKERENFQIQVYVKKDDVRCEMKYSSIEI